MKILCWVLNNHQWSEWNVFHWNFNEREGGEERTCKWCDKTEKRRIGLDRQGKNLIGLDRQDKDLGVRMSESVES